MPTYRVCYVKVRRSLCYREIDATDPAEARRIAEETRGQTYDLDDDPDSSHDVVELELTASEPELMDDDNEQEDAF